MVFPLEPYARLRAAAVSRRAPLHSPRRGDFQRRVTGRGWRRVGAGGGLGFRGSR